MDWEESLDALMRNPPENETKCHCAWCKEDLYYDDEYWDLDDEILCEDCAEKWLADHKNWVSARMARGE